MLRAFSRIRKTLINEGKTSRYIRYALGEFLLIVAGILVALQIQNWNEGRKLDHDRQELIENLKADFQTNLMRLEEIIPVGVNSLEKTKLFLGIAGGDNSDLSLNELKTLAGEAYGGFRFRPTLPAYEAAITTGSIGLIGSPELNKLFIQFKQSDDTFQVTTNFSFQEANLGGGTELRKQLGSWEIMGEFRLPNPPEAFNLSTQEYRNFIAQKEVYAIFENMLVFHALKLAALNEMKNTTEQILTALDALE
ncbi:MAG: DUF6090 family protein [Verrucomicrobia bacterium]|nr:DUF6090 family protein [Verrucomicrobiota bacterium]MDA1068353.1 DUF6090 family protein [Verrucomicrobiota bacterium]